MKHSALWLAAGTLAIFLSTAAAATAKDMDSQKMTIGALPDKGSVTLSGTVQEVKNEREFTLKDDSGDIAVTMPAGKSAVLKEGDAVTVSGKIEKTMLGKHIQASRVNQSKDLSAAISDSITEHTDLSIDKAKPTSVKALPKEGMMVKLSGSVDDVKDEKNFTLKDSTGSVEVSIQSDENVVLEKGSKVTVIGYVHEGMFGSKDIRANHIILTADASPARYRPAR